jgi:hypothetical protein
MPGPVLGVSLALFAVSAVIEGAITVAVVLALERIQPNAMRMPGGGRSPAFAALALVAVLLAAGGVVFASTSPDGIERLAMQTGIASHARTLIATPLKDYQAAWLGSGWPAQAGAGLAGLGLVYGACLMIGRKR